MWPFVFSGATNVDAIVLRLEDLSPVRAPETFAPEELVIVVEAVPMIVTLGELAEPEREAA